MKTKQDTAGVSEINRHTSWTSRTLVRCGDFGRYLGNVATCITAVIICTFAAGCSRSEFKIPLSATEIVKEGDLVELAETGTKIGRCIKVDDSGPTKVALIVINHSARLTLRTGAERVAAGKLVLANGPENAPPLPPGSLIKTRAPIDQVAKRSLGAIAHSWNAVADLACDHPAVATIAGICALLIIFGLFRALSGKAVLILLLLAVLAAVAPQLQAAVKSGDVEKGLVAIEALVEAATRETATADHYSQAAAPALFESATVRAMFSLDRALALSVGAHRDLGNLSVWTTEETTRMLRNRFEQTAVRCSTLETQLIRLATSSTSRRDGLPRLYVLERAFIRERINAGLTDSAVIIQDLSALRHLPLSFVEAAIITLENAPHVKVRENGIELPNGDVFSLDNPEERQRKAVELSTVKDKVAELEKANSELRDKIERAPAATAPASPFVLWLSPPEATASRAPEPRSEEREEPVVPKSNAGPDSPARTDSTVASANDSPARFLESKDRAPLIDQTQLGGKESETVTTVDQIKSWVDARRVFLGICGGLVLLVVLAIVLLLPSDSGLSISIADQSESAAEFEVPPGSAVILSEAPFVGVAHGLEEAPRIEATKGKAILVPHCDGVELNGAKITSRQKLSPGDRISVPRAAGGLRSFEFLSAERLTATASA